MRSRRFCVFCHLSQIAELSDVSLSMSINANIIELARPISGKIGFMKSIGPKNRSNALSNARLFRRVMDSGIVVVVVAWLMKTNEKRAFVQKVCSAN